MLLHTQLILLIVPNLLETLFARLCLFLLKQKITMLNKSRLRKSLIFRQNKNSRWRMYLQNSKQVERSVSYCFTLSPSQTSPWFSEYKNIPLVFDKVYLTSSTFCSKRLNNRFKINCILNVTKTSQAMKYIPILSTIWWRKNCLLTCPWKCQHLRQKHEIVSSSGIRTRIFLSYDTNRFYFCITFGNSAL